MKARIDSRKKKLVKQEERGYAKDCQARNLNKEDAMDRGTWKKMIKIG